VRLSRGSFHVSGLCVLVGFSDKLRLMNLLIDDIRPYKELAIRACREVRFSHGGQMFAAVNGNTIQVYSTHSCDNIGNLRGHNNKARAAPRRPQIIAPARRQRQRTQRARARRRALARPLPSDRRCPLALVAAAQVRSLCWTPDDTKLISCGLDGAVYEWAIKDFKRLSENVLKSCAYTSVACTADARVLFAVGTDRKLKEIVGDTPKDWDLCARRAAPRAARPPPACTRLPPLRARLRRLCVSSPSRRVASPPYARPSPASHRPPPAAPSPPSCGPCSNVLATQVVLSHSGRMLFAGLENGAVRSFKFPLNGEFADVPVHGAASGVSRLRISHDDAHLFSVGDDGCVYICEVRRRPLGSGGGHARARSSEERASARGE
jgi:WD40 repeat protein